MRSVLVLCCLTLAASLLSPLAPAASAQPDGFRPAQVDSFVTGYLDRHGLAGAAVAVVKDGEPVHAAGYGEDSQGAGVTEQTRMRIGSVGKSFTAFALLRLVDEGRVELDAPVKRYLPEFGHDAITVGHLLSHTSGLPSPLIVGPAQNLAEGAARVDDWTLTSKPGTSYAYSNANYWVAARVAEEVSGQDFHRFLDEAVFTPLGMDDTVSTPTTGHPVDDLADGHVTAYGTALPAPEAEQMNSGAGGITSTARDMAAWLAMQQRGGIGPDGERLLSAELIKRSHTPQPNAGTYGLGWQRSSPGITPKRISHSGSTTTFSAQQALVPSSGYGVVVLLNSFTPTFEHPYEISSGVIEVTEGRDPEPTQPVAMWIDLVLGAVAAAALGLGAWGLRRARRWSARRSAWPLWRFVLRLLPQQLGPALAVFLFLIVPALQANSYTPADLLRLFPALTVLVLALALVGIGLTAARVRARLRS